MSYPTNINHFHYSRDCQALRYTFDLLFIGGKINKRQLKYIERDAILWADAEYYAILPKITEGDLVEVVMSKPITEYAKK